MGALAGFLMPVQGYCAEVPILRRSEGSAPPAGLKALTFAGEVAASVTPVTLANEVTIGILPETLTGADSGVLNAKLQDLFPATRQPWKFSIVIADGDETVRLGPYTVRSQFQAAVRKVIAMLPSGATARVPLASAVFGRLQRLIPRDSGAWSTMLMVARLPDPGQDAEAYLAAYLANLFRAGRLRTAYWSPGGERSRIFELIARETAAPVAPLEPAEILRTEMPQGTSYVEIKWPSPELSAGFHLYNAVLRAGAEETLGAYTAIAVGRGSALPEPARVQELRSCAASLKELALAAEMPRDAALKAREWMARALAINPRDQETLRTGASILQRQGELKEAAALLEFLIETRPQDGDLYAEAGDAWYRAREFARAEAHLLRATQLGSPKDLVYEQLGRIAVAGGRYREALPFLEQCLARNPRNSAAWFLRADCAVHANDAGGATDFIEHGLALAPQDIDYRMRLIQLYLERNESEKALAHIRLIARDPPRDAGAQAAFAGFVEKAGSPDEALTMWRGILAIDPAMEKAHLSIVQILTAKGDLEAAVAAAREGLARCPASARLYVLKADAEERIGLWRQSRSTLQAGVDAVADLDLLRRHAAAEDRYGLKAAEAYEKLAAALRAAGRPQQEQNPVLERGLLVAVRDGDWKRTAAFSALFKAAGEPQLAGLAVSIAKESPRDALIPGGRAAVLRLIGIKDSTKPEDYFLELARHLSSAINAKSASAELKERIDGHFRMVHQLELYGTRDGDRVRVHLSFRDRNQRRDTEGALAALGWKIDSSGGRLKIEPAERTSAAKRQETAAALALDEIAMQEALQSGRDFDLTIVDEKVPILFGAPSWVQAFPASEESAGGLTSVFAANPLLADLYIGLANLDDATAEGLVRDFGLRVLAEKHAALLYGCAGAIVVQHGRVALPGGEAAAPVWLRLVGANAAAPKQFLSNLLGKDDGKLLAFYALLMQLDLPRQKFFTASETRTERFYELFKDTLDLKVSAVLRFRYLAFADFMRQIPLDNQGHVIFPGSPQVWMVAKGQSASVSRSTSLIRQASRIAAPDVEDQILLRLAKTEYTSGLENVSELSNFLAVQRVDAHRTRPLDEAAAILLAQHYASHRQAWPYLVLCGDLDAEDYASFFRMSEYLFSFDSLVRNEAMGELNALLKILSLLRDSGRIDPKSTVELFRTICARFQKADESAGFAAAALDMLRDLIAAAHGEGDADEAVRDALLEHGAPVSFSFNGADYAVSRPEAQAHAFQEVLALQKVPALAVLLEIYRSATDLSAAKGSPAELAARVIAAVKRLPDVEIPEMPELRGSAKELLHSLRLTQIRKVCEDLQKAASQKPPDGKKLASVARQLMAALNPQVRLALTGIIYAYYLSPHDLLISDDPLFLRRHQFVGSASSFNVRSVWVDSSLQPAGKTGSFFFGGFAGFAALGGAASMSTTRQIDTTVKPVGAAIIGTLHETNWSNIREPELHAAALKMRAGREWVVFAAVSPEMFSALSEETSGLLSPGRRAELLRAVSEHRWSTAWQVLTLSDLFFLGDAYLHRFDKDPVSSPVLAGLRSAVGKSRPEQERWLGADSQALSVCSHPHLMRLAPYEYYETFVVPEMLAARTNEFKLYLAEFIDRRGLPAEVLGAVAEPLVIQLLRGLRLTVSADWRSVLAAFSEIDDRIMEKVLEKK